MKKEREAGCPAPCVLCKGRVPASSQIFHPHLQNVIIVDPHQPSLTKGIASKTTPTPVLRLQDQSPRYRIPVHVAQLFDSLLLRPNIEIVEARLPDGRRGCRVPRSLRFLQGTGACWTPLPAPGHNSLRKPLFYTLHRRRRCPCRRLAQQSGALCALLQESSETDHGVHRCRARAFFDSNCR